MTSAIDVSAITPTGDVDILGVQVANVSMSQAIAIINDYVRQGRGGVINFLNAHCANVAMGDADYKSALDASDYVFADGSGVKIASTLMGTPFIDNVNGTDLAPALFEFFEDTDTTFAFVGGRPGVAQTAANRVSYQFPNLKKPLPYHGYKSEEEWVALAKELAELRPSIIFVALGVPLQEKRIEMLSQYLPDCLLIGVGGLLDFLAQRIPRAPHLFRAVGCEWVWRLIQEPGRMWRRYLIGNIVFLYRAVYYALKHRG